MYGHTSEFCERVATVGWFRAGLVVCVVVGLGASVWVLAEMQALL